MSPRSVLRSMLVVASVYASMAHAYEDTVLLEPVADNTLYEDAEVDRSNGAGDHFFAGRVGGAGLIRRGLLAFSLADSVVPGSTIDSVAVQLHMSRTITGAQTVSLHRVLQSWGEASSHAPGQEGQGTVATTGDATWVHRFFDTDAWAIAGGVFNPAASASASVVGIDFYTWSSSSLIADVQAWLDDPSANFGWIVVGNEAVTTTAKRFDSRENPSLAMRPKLFVRFTTPTDVVVGPIPSALRLHANHPNPFNPGTTISYDLGTSRRVLLRVFDVSGRLVRSLVDRHEIAGPHDVFWDGRDDQGRRSTSGVYLYQLRADGYTQTRSMLLVK